MPSADDLDCTVHVGCYATVHLPECPRAESPPASHDINTIREAIGPLHAASSARKRGGHAALDRVEARLAEAEAKIERLTSRGIEDLQFSLEQAERERDEAVDLHVDAVTLAGEHLDRAEAADARVAALTEALADAVDVAIWLTGLCEIPVDSAWPELREKLLKAHAALAGPPAEEKT